MCRRSPHALPPRWVANVPDTTFHTLRHTHATLLGTRPEVDAVTLAARMGHSDVATTKRHYIIPQHDRARAFADLAASLDPFTDEG